MRAVIQRVKESSVSVEGRIVGKIGKGLLVLLGVSKKDCQREAEYLVDKIIHLRIFEDKNGKMNRSLVDIEGQLLVISQFTLLADCRRGRRPSFIDAAEPQTANTLYEYFIRQAKLRDITVQSGQFGALMEVSLINDGPVTITLESPCD